MGWSKPLAIFVKAFVALLLTAHLFGGAATSVALASGVWRFDAASFGGISAADARALKQPYVDLAAGNGDAVIASFAEGVDREAARAQFQRLRAYIPPGAQSSSRLLRWTMTNSGKQSLVGIHEYDYPDHVVRVETNLVRSTKSEAWRLLGLHLRVAQRAELAASGFTLNGGPASFLVFLAATTLIPVFCWATGLFALFRNSLRMRWLWVLFSFVGVAKISMNGATGTISVAPLSVHLFGNGATWSGSAFDPWMFGVSLPVGALAVWAGWLIARNPAPQSGGA